MVAWQRSGALEAFPRYHDNRSRWTNREAELLSWVAAGQVHLWTMLGARGLPATGPGGQRLFALLQRSPSSAEMNVPRTRHREKERERGADGWWCSILISRTDDERFREEPRRICCTPRYGLSLGTNYLTVEALPSDGDIQTGTKIPVSWNANVRPVHTIHYSSKISFNVILLSTTRSTTRYLLRYHVSVTASTSYIADSLFFKILTQNSRKTAGWRIGPSPVPFYNPNRDKE